MGSLPRAPFMQERPLPANGIIIRNITTTVRGCSGIIMYFCWTLEKRRRRRRRNWSRVGGLSCEHVACLQITATKLSVREFGLHLAEICRSFPPSRLKRRWGRRRCWCCCSTSERLPRPHSRSQSSGSNLLPSSCTVLLPRCCVKRLPDPHTAGRWQQTHRIRSSLCTRRKGGGKKESRTEPNREGDICAEEERGNL